MDVDLRCGDAADVLTAIPAGTARCCITSPPYFGLRDYGTGRREGGDPACEHRGPPRQSRKSTLAGNGHGNGKPLSPMLQDLSQPVRDTCGRCGARRVDRQIGLETTPGEYVARLVEVFRGVRRVLTEDGTVWLNLGDSCSAVGKSGGGNQGEGWEKNGADYCGPRGGKWRPAPGGLGPKQLIGMPWRVALALQDDGWILRSDIIRAKSNPMPESVRDRPTKSHEYLFLLTKQPKYYYDCESVKEPLAESSLSRYNYDFGGHKNHALVVADKGGIGRRTSVIGSRSLPTKRDRRSVWFLASRPYAGAHFATFPEALAEPRILAGSAPGDVVLDPFCGSGTAGAVAVRHGRRFLGIDLNPDYLGLARRRIAEARRPPSLFE